MRSNRTGWLGLIAAAGLAAAANAQTPGRSAEKPSLAFKVAKVVTMDPQDRIVNDAVVLVSGGKIEKVGAAGETPIPAGYETREFAECWLVPGLVEGHNHIAGGLADLNDMVYQTNPGLDTRSTIDPNNRNVKRARAGGVSTMMLIPGSGTNMSGFGTLAKSGGDTPDEVIIRSPGSLKIAQAGNPEWYFGGNNRSFMNWNTRQTLLKARAYHEAWTEFEAGRTKQKPEFDPIWDGFRGLFKREYPVTVHTQIYQVVMTTVEMLSRGLKLWVVLDHSEFDGWKVGPLVVGSDVWVICGPRGFHFDRMANRLVGFAAAWWKNGVRRVGINTDAPVIPQEELFYQATMHCWFGWVPYAGLCGVTKVPAQALGLYDRLGSIESKKDADFGIWTGDPLDPRSACLMMVVNGKIVYDGTKGRRPF
ncbi:MAG: amidohydrolase family protein [Phycisphaerales bacterium]|nr:amidohydrolase family protein [Phycisphaerales bacterium]